MSARDSAREIWRDITINGVAASPLIPHRIRWRLLRLFGLDVSASRICGRCFFGGTSVRIGTGTFINYNAFIDCGARVAVGERVRFGPNVTILTGSHEIGMPAQRAGRAFSEEVVIEDGVWIGAGAVVLPGSVIRRGAVIAAGAVVRGECAANSLYGGVPARLLRALPTSPEA